jgi:hypothetical protein
MQRFSLFVTTFCFAANLGPLLLSTGFAEAEPSEVDAVEQEQTETVDGLVVRELVILVSDKYRETANAEQLFEAAMPMGGQNSRDRSVTGQPMPGGIITFENTSQESLEPFDVLVELEDGKFMGAWPHPSRRKTERVLWRNIVLVGEAEAHVALQNEERHWLEPLRQTDRAAVQVTGTTDRLFYYDAAIAYGNPLEIAAGEAGYRVKIADERTVHDLILAERDEENAEQLRFAYLKILPQGSEASSPQPEDTNFENASDESDVAAEATAAVDGTTISLTEATDDYQLFAKLEASLSSQGLGQPEIEHAQRVLSSYASAEDGLAVVYRLDRQTLDDLIPVEIIPEPAAHHRVGLVVLLNSDPALATRIAELIQTLGSETWRDREEAQQKLGSMGHAAATVLEEHADHDDPEVAMRVQQLLSDHKKVNR